MVMRMAMVVVSVPATLECLQDDQHWQDKVGKRMVDLHHGDALLDDVFRLNAVFEKGADGIVF
jgi:hypothetical protein